MKTKLLIVLMAAALMLTISGTTQAGSFSADGWDMPVVMHLTNWDQGTIWLGADGTYNDPYNQLFRIGPNGAHGDEDAWGIARIDQIMPGYPSEDHKNVLPTGADALYNDGDSGMEIFVMFWGEQDKWTQLATDSITGAQSQLVLGEGMKVEFWAQPDDTFVNTYGMTSTDEELFGSAGRWVDGNHETYLGIGHDAVGGIIPGASLWGSGSASPGFMAPPTFPEPYNFDVDFKTQFWPAGTQNGEGEMYWDLEQVTSAGEGTANETWDNDWYWSQYWPGETADIRLEFNTSLVGPGHPAQYDWLVTSSDPMQTYGVPEPVTMLGVFLGVSSLTGYLRRRKLA